jgi:hypothetical protein
VKGVWLCLRRVRVSCLVQRKVAPPTLWTLVLFAPLDLLLWSAVRSVPPVSLGPSAPQPAVYPAPPVHLEATAAPANLNAPFVSLARSAPFLLLSSARLAHLACTAPASVLRKEPRATRASTAPLDPLLKPRAPKAASVPRVSGLQPLAPKAHSTLHLEARLSQPAPFVTLEHSTLHSENQLVQHVMPGLSTPQPETALH